MEDYNKVPDLDDSNEFDNVDVSELRINPSFYLHVGILNCQNALNESNIQAGFTKFIVHVNTLTSMAKAVKYLPNDFDDMIDEYKHTPEYQEVNDYVGKESKLAIKKFELVLKYIFESRMINMPLKC